MTRSWRHRLAYVVLPAASVLMAVTLLESFLRLTGLQPDFFFQPDPDISVTYIPGKHGWNVIGRHRQWIEINSFGYRDREWTVAKPRGTRRVALLGDSYVAGLEVPAQQRLSALLEERLNRDCNDGQHYEVLNFGVTGYGTAQELETLRHRALQFRPDLVLLFFYTGNDLFDNSLQLDPEPNRLHYVLTGSGQLQAQPFTVNDNALKRWLRAHSKAYNFLRDRISTLQALHRTMIRIGFMQDATASQEAVSALDALQGSQYLRDTPPAIDDAWTVTRALVAEVQRVASANAAAFAVTVIPTKPAILDVPPSGDGHGARTRERWDMDQPARRMLAICGDLGIDCVDLTGVFRKPGVDVEQCFFSEGHWTPAGHGIAANAVFTALRTTLCGGGGVTTASQAAN